MKILFDQGVPVPLRKALRHHEVATAYEKAWSQLQNGHLIAMAESSGFETFVTTDRNLKYQQNLTKRRLVIVVLCTTSWPKIQGHLDEVVSAINQATLGSYHEVSMPDATSGSS